MFASELKVGDIISLTIQNKSIYGEVESVTPIYDDWVEPYEIKFKNGETICILGNVELEKFNIRFYWRPHLENLFRDINN